MYRLKDIISDTEEPDILGNDIDVSKTPITKPSSLDWKVNDKPNRLTKIFKFSNETNFNEFVIDLLELQSETQHHARITLQYPQVKVDIWTHSLNEITEVDIEWAQSANEIEEGYNG